LLGELAGNDRQRALLQRALEGPLMGRRVEDEAVDREHAVRAHREQAVVAEGDTHRAVGARDHEVALLDHAADRRRHALARALDLDHALRDLDLPRILGGAGLQHADRQRQRQRQDNCWKFHRILLDIAPVDRFPEWGRGAPRPDVYIVAESLSRASQIGGRARAIASIPETTTESFRPGRTRYPRWRNSSPRCARPGAGLIRPASV